jgi:superfamily II DNA or RNA helicase
MFSPDDVTPNALARITDPGTSERGQRYFAQGRAEVLDVHHDPDDEVVHILALCRGSAHHVYRQDVILSRMFGQLAIDGQCSCPVGFNCKHVVAACLAWQAMARGERQEQDPTTTWLESLSAAVEPAAAPSPDGQALIYELLEFAEPDTGTHGIGVEIRLARRKNNGDWTKGRTRSLSSIHDDQWLRQDDYLEPIDREIVRLLAGEEQVFGSGPIPLFGRAGSAAVQAMGESGRLFIRTPKARIGPLLPGPARTLKLHWHRDGDTYYLLPDMSDGCVTFTEIEPACYFDLPRLQVGPLDPPPGVDPRAMPLLGHAPPVSREQAGRISRRIALEQPGLPTPEPVTAEPVHARAQPRLRVFLDPHQPADAHVELDFLYDDTRIDPGNPADPQMVDDGERLRAIYRDREAEKRARERLAAIGLEADDSPRRFRLPASPAEPSARLAAWLELFENAFPTLGDDGWLIEQSTDRTVTVRHADSIRAQVDSPGNDWFDLRFDIEVDGKPVPLLPLVGQLLEQHRPDELPETVYLEAHPGHYLGIPGKRIAPVLDTLLSLHADRSEPTGLDPETLRLSRLDAPRLLELGDVDLRGGEDMQSLARKLHDFAGIRRVEPPATFHGTLRPYQQQGVDWLQFLREYELGGILADDMGLGKTVQTLAHLAVEKAEGRLDRPALIVAPTSLMGNWHREADRFTPDLNVLILHGPDRARHFETIADRDLVLTTYPLLPRDREVLSEQSWHSLILDEAQQIKNPRSQAAQLVRTLNTRHRLCLTGTPMENHLGELWAQFDFLMPGFLGDRTHFNRHYRTPVEKHGEQDTLARLTRRIRPFILRRTKDRVAGDLPEKTELLRTVPLGAKQATLYESIRLAMEKRVRDAIAEKGLARSHITILDALLKLRQACCDPRLLPKSTRGSAGAGSAKLDMLMELLPEMLEEGRRILLFSQFTTMLGLIEKELKQRDIPYSKLTGQTHKREAAIERFCRGEAHVFLISLKAGGVGLNLTEADTVIHYDPWWNPAVEAQATDRAHRIGQERPVFVYKLITEGTLEEKILELQARKQKLADHVHAHDGNDEAPDGDQPPIDADALRILLADDR